MAEVLAEMEAEGIQFPAVIRFHDILRSQVEILNETFRDTIETAGYEGEYVGVYPIKVNQMREVVEEIMDAGEPYNYGLEAGSKPELMAVMAYNENPDALTILNGYKDEGLPDHGVVRPPPRPQNDRRCREGFSELEMLVRLFEEVQSRPHDWLAAQK